LLGRAYGGSAPLQHGRKSILPCYRFSRQGSFELSHSRQRLLLHLPLAAKDRIGRKLKRTQPMHLEKSATIFDIESFSERN